MRLHSYATLAAAVFMLGTSASPSAAAQGKAAKAAQPQNDFTAQIAELRQVRALLQSANHDYKGHRAKAVTELSHAIRHLQGPTAHPKGAKAANKPGAKVPPVHESQKLSDQQLQQAATAVAAIGQQLTGAKGKHAPKAMVHLNNAVNEIQTALSVSPKIP